MKILERSLSGFLLAVILLCMALVTTGFVDMRGRLPRRGFEIRDDQQGHVIVTDVEAGSAAARLQADDQITAVAFTPQDWSNPHRLFQWPRGVNGIGGSYGVKILRQSSLHELTLYPERNSGDWRLGEGIERLALGWLAVAVIFWVILTRSLLWRQFIVFLAPLSLAIPGVWRGGMPWRDWHIPLTVLMVIVWLVYLILSTRLEEKTRSRRR